MKMKLAVTALVATSLVTTPVVAQAATAARTGSPVGDAENLQGGWLVPAIAIIAILLGIWVLIDGDDDDLPTSP